MPLRAVVLQSCSTNQALENWRMSMHFTKKTCKVQEKMISMKAIRAFDGNEGNYPTVGLG